MSASTITQTFSLPKALFDYWKSKKMVEKKLVQLSVLELLREKRITASRAAELLGMRLQDVLELMWRYKIPYLDYKKGEVKKEFETLKEAFDKTKEK